MLVHELKTILPHYTVPLLKNNTVFSEYARAYSPDYVIFMPNTRCTVQYRGITLIILKIWPSTVKTHNEIKGLSLTQTRELSAFSTKPTQTKK